MGRAWFALGLLALIIAVGFFGADGNVAPDETCPVVMDAGTVEACAMIEEARAGPVQVVADYESVAAAGSVTKNSESREANLVDSMRNVTGNRGHTTEGYPLLRFCARPARA